MADEQSEQGALSAVEAFFSEGDRESLADREEPTIDDSAVQAELQQQEDSLVQEGVVDENGVAPEPEKPADKPAAEQPNKPEVKTPAEQPAGVDPVIRQIANEAGWSDERIDRLFKADPELALEMLQQTADQYVDSSRQMVQSPGPQQPAPVQQQPAQSDLPQLLTDEGLAKFAESNGEEAANVIKALRDQVLGPVQELQRAALEREQQEIATQANDAVDKIAEKFPDVYGKGSVNSITVQQYNARRDLFVRADQLLAGAKAQGRSLTVAEAINRANAILTYDQSKAQARKEIASKVQSRAKSALSKPTQRVNPAKPVQGEKSDKAAIEAAQQKWALLSVE